jgi:putative nucleotidyltransferase with HDIG domain
MDLRTLELKVARSENLPVLPQVVSAAFKIVDDPKCTALDLERLIDQDAALTAKILRVVNSPMYAVGQVATVGRALAVLGTNRVRSLITSIALQNLAAERQQASSFNKLEYWRHSLAVATAARTIAKSARPAQMEELYVAGLLHDIGLLLMDKFCPDDLDSVISYAKGQGIPLCEAEAATGSFGHADLGAVLTQRWGMGDFLVNAVAKHHDPFVLADENSPAAVLFVADALAHSTGFTNQVPSVQYDVSTDMFASVSIREDQVEGIRNLLCVELESVEKTFSFSGAPGASNASPAVARSPRLSRLSA